MRAPLLISFAVVGLLGCQDSKPSGQQQSWPLEQAPAEVRPAVERATASFAALQQSLTQRLQAAMAEGGPTAAIEVCRTAAQPLTAEVAKTQELEVGRTSHKLRNEKNAPRAWAADYVSTHAGRKAAEVQGRVFELGGRVGVLKPIPTGALCLTCHGQQVSEELQQKIVAAYPADRATGFSEGELRGFFWAEVPRAAR